MKLSKSFLIAETKLKSQTEIILMKRFRLDINKYHNQMSGGVADDRTIEDIERIPVKTLIKGINTEMEHTDDPYIALEIALDHLYEKEPFSFAYYDQLEQMGNILKN